MALLRNLNRNRVLNRLWLDAKGRAEEWRVGGAKDWQLLGAGVPFRISLAPLPAVARSRLGVGKRHAKR